MSPCCSHAPASCSNPAGLGVLLVFNSGPFNSSPSHYHETLLHPVPLSPIAPQPTRSSCTSPPRLIPASGLSVSAGTIPPSSIDPFSGGCKAVVGIGHCCSPALPREQRCFPVPDADLKNKWAGLVPGLSNGSVGVSDLKTADGILANVGRGGTCPPDSLKPMF